jgi:tRNA A-37 threonylcarbamoyl transferase component Bud32
MDHFYPILKKIKTNNNYSNKWKLIENITDNVGGESGEIYTVKNEFTNSTNQTYILKYMPFTDQYSDAPVIDTSRLKEMERLALQEIEIQNKCFSIGISPEIIEAWICEKGSVIIMIKLQITLSELMIQYSDLSVNNLIITNVLDVMKIMHNNGISHGDPHTENFMVTSKIYSKTLINGETQLQHYKRMNFKYYVIDFGSTDGSSIKDDYSIFIGMLHHSFEEKYLKNLYQSINLFTNEEIENKFIRSNRMKSLLLRR